MKRHLFLPLFLLSVLVALPADINSVLEVDAVIGFSGLVKKGRWNPVVISMYNPGDSLDGELEVMVVQGTTLRAERTQVFKRTVSLPSRSRKRFQFAIPVYSPGVPVTVTFTSGGEQYFFAEYSLMGKVVDSPLMLALSRSSSFDFLMQLTDIIVTYPHVETLPERWDAYDSADFITVHNADMSLLTQAQVTALEKWIESGGTILISGGSHLTSQAGPLADLLPVSVMGLARAPDLDELSSLLEVEIFGGNEAVISMSAAKRGTVEAASDGIPLIVTERRGRGSIIYFAGDLGAPPYTETAFREALWRYINIRHAERPMQELPGRIFEDLALPALLNLQQNRGYSRQVLFGFLAVYLAAALFLFSGKTVKYLRRWLAAIVLSSLLCVGAYLLFSQNLLKSEFIMIDRTILNTGLNQNYATAEKDVVLVSLADGTYTLTINRSDTVVLDRGQQKTTIDMGHFAGDTLSIADIRIPGWSQDSYRFVTQVPFSLKGHLYRRGDNLNLFLDNRSGVTIQDTLLVYRGEIYPTGTISPGGTVNRQLDFVSSPMAGPAISLDRELYENQPIRYEVLTSLLENESFLAETATGAVVLVGWMSDSTFRSSVDKDFVNRRDINMLMTVMHAQKEEDQ